MKSTTFAQAIKGSRAFETIKRDIASGIGHAYMVISPDDDLVEEFFTLTAAAVYCPDHTPCLTCAACRKVLHDNHEDVIFFNTERAKVKIAQFRDLLSDVSIKPLSGRKLYFIERADLLTPQIQNSLLKTFEEPPENVTIFLGVANEAGMLETLKSRSRKIYMDLFDADTVYDALIALGTDERLSYIASECCEGMPGKALKLASSEQYAKLYDDAVRLLSTVGQSSDIMWRDALLADSPDFEGMLDVLSIIVRDMLVASKNMDMMLSKHISAEILRLSQRYSPAALARILFLINDARKKVGLYMNKYAVADSLLFSILEVRHKWQS